MDLKYLLHGTVSQNLIYEISDLITRKDILFNLKQILYFIRIKLSLVYSKHIID